MGKGFDEHIFLTGFMGSGKSSVAKSLSSASGQDMVDCDKMIEMVSGISIDEIFKTNGEEAFRDIETSLLKAIAGMGPKIVSCGGGMVLRESNRNLMKESGKIIWLRATAETIFKRLENDDTRPLLKGKKSIEDIEKMLSDRDAYYRDAADIIIDTDGKSPEEISWEISEKLK